MTDITAKFSLIDEISDKFEAMADAAGRAIDAWESAADTVSAALNEVQGSAEELSERIRGFEDDARGIETVTDSFNEMNETVGEADDAFSRVQDSMGMTQTAAETLADAVSIEMEMAADSVDELSLSFDEVADAADAFTMEMDDNADAVENINNDVGESYDDLASTAKSAFTKVGEEAQNLQQLLIALGLAKIAQEITEEFEQMARSYDEAQSIIVKATGATGDALDDLSESALNIWSVVDEGSINTVASAVGELNTRLGVTGEQLEHLGKKVVDYADNNNTNATSSVKNLTKIMNQYGLEVSDLDSLMDKLTYTAQRSGASVDQMSSTLTTGAATFQLAGLSIDNAINLMGDFELAGIRSQTAIRGLRTAVNHFASAGVDAKEGLMDVIEQIATMEDQTEATTLATQTFGTMAGQQLALAIRNGTISVETFNATLDDAIGTLDRTEEAADTMSDHWTEATNKFSAAFTKVLSPTFQKVSNFLADTVGKIGEFLEAHPVIVKILTVMAVGIASITAALAAYTIGVKIAHAVTLAFEASNPFGWVAIAVSALASLVAAIVLFAKTEDETTREINSLTDASREQYYAMQDANEEYDRAVEQYGEFSDEAIAAKAKVNELTDAYETNKMTMEELRTEVHDLTDAFARSKEEYENNIKAINNTETDALALVFRLDELVSSGSRTAESQLMIEDIIEELNSSVDGLNLAYSDLLFSQETAIGKTKELIKAQAEDELAAEKRDRLKELYKEQLAAEEALEKVNQNEGKTIREAEEAYQRYLDTIAAAPPFDEVTGFSAEAQNAYAEYLSEISGMHVEEAKALMAEAEDALAGVNSQIEELEKELGLTSDTIDDVADATSVLTTEQEAVSIAFESVKEELYELCAAYEEAYNSAYESFHGQFGLFDEAQADAEATVEAAQAALESQLAYWQNYNANIEVLKQYSADDLHMTQENYDALFSYVQNGTPEAVGLAQSMVDTINESGTDALMGLGDTFSQVQEQQEIAASQIADWQTDFNNKLDEIQLKMNDTVVFGLDMQSEAESSAIKTMDGYIDGLRSGGNQAVSLAESIATRITNALNVSTNVNVGVQQNALGTTYAANMFLAGEKGPELIALRGYADGTTYAQGGFYMAGMNGPEVISGAEGSTVFPHEETDRLMRTLNGTGYSEEKRITLEINGNGVIDIGKSDKGTILRVMEENIKPVLMSIIQSEMYEEGDLSYEY